MTVLLLRSATIYYWEVETILGSISLACTKHGLCWLSYASGESALRELEAWANKIFLKSQVQHDELALRETTKQLEEYFARRRKKFDLPLDLVGTAFQKRVWQALLEIPYGEVRTYKQIAQAIGAPKAVRAVGGANNKNKLPIFVPCHRVIGSNGSLVGYRSGLAIKRQLLDLEGYQPTIS